MKTLGKRQKYCLSTVSKVRDALRSSPRDNRDQEIIEKAQKYAISGLFLYPNLFDSFSRILKKNRSDLVVNTGATTPLVVNFWGTTRENNGEKEVADSVVKRRLVFPLKSLLVNDAQQKALLPGVFVFSEE